MKASALKFMFVLWLLGQVSGVASTGTLPATFLLYEFLKQSSTPQDVGSFLKTYFSYAEDRKQFGAEDYWQSPEEFLMSQSGDCEDFALLSQYLLSRLGFQAYVITIYGQGEYAHTVTIFKNRTGYFDVVNLDKLIEVGSPTLEGAISRVYAGWNWAGIAEIRNSRGWMLRKIYRPLKA